MIWRGGAGLEPDNVHCKASTTVTYWKQPPQAILYALLLLANIAPVRKRPAMLDSHLKNLPPIP